MTESVNLGSYTCLNAGNIESQELGDYKTEIGPNSNAAFNHPMPTISIKPLSPQT